MKKRVGVLLAVLVGGLLLAGCQLPTFGARSPVTRQGTDSIKLWQGFFIAGAVVFVFVLVLIVWAAIRYRRRSDGIPPQTQYHTLIEILYTSIPVVVVLVLFGFTFVTENNVDALPKPAVSVTVTAFQWGWKFTYTASTTPTATHAPGYVMSTGKHRPTFSVIGVETEDPEMVLPAHEDVRVYLQSADVIHGFYVPAIDFSRYAQPGVTNKFTLTVDRTGTFRGQCTQFCGLYHSLMRFRLKAVTDSQFKTWLSSHSATAKTAGTSLILGQQQAANLGGSAT